MFVPVILSGLIIACAGYIAQKTHTEIENLFVFAAGIANFYAILDLKNVAFDEKRNKVNRILLTLELFFFSAVLGVDIQLGLGFLDNLLLILASCFVFVSLLYVAGSDDPKEKLTFLVSVILLVMSLYLFPAIIKLSAPVVNNLCGKYDLWTKVVHVRIYSWIHLFAIPLVYSIVDHRISKEDIKWKDFLFLDKTLLLVGLACMMSGFLYAFLGMKNAVEPIKPLYEAGAAAVILLVGNSWYVNVRKNQCKNQQSD
jgi:D-alanyl-lipoteichoic acid acyltransferase DltB (MBOAT superfamily)